jgi:hypothetical protein
MRDEMEMRKIGNDLIIGIEPKIEYIQKTLREVIVEALQYNKEKIEDIEYHKFTYPKNIDDDFNESQENDIIFYTKNNVYFTINQYCCDHNCYIDSVPRNPQNNG